MSKAKMKMGFIGVGHMGQYHVNVVTQLSATHEISGLYDASESRAKELSAKFNVPAYATAEDVIEKSDAVTIAVPTHLHYKYTKIALEAGRHVLVEKPVTETLEQADELIRIAREKNLILQVGHVERFNGAVMELSKIVKEPRLIQARRLTPVNNRITDVGVVLDLMIHDLDILLNLVDSRVKSYNAVGSKVITENEDVAVIDLQFENGTIATITASRISQYKERSLSIMEDKSFVYLNYANQDIEIHRQASSVTLLTPDEIKYSQESFMEKVYIHKDNPLKSEHSHFYDTIQGGKAMVPNEKDLETLRIALGSLQMIHDSWK